MIVVQLCGRLLIAAILVAMQTSELRFSGPLELVDSFHKMTVIRNVFSCHFFSNDNCELSQHWYVVILLDSFRRN